MIEYDNVYGKKSEKKMEVDDGLRTVECLRGRLLAERVASRIAKIDASQMGNKLIELETLLRVEIKSRNKAEKRLTFLVKKLESLNIPYLPRDYLQHSGLLEKSDMLSSSSVSSTASSVTEQPEHNKEPKTQITVPNLQKMNFPLVSKDLEESASQTHSSNQSHSSAVDEGSLSSTNKARFEEPIEVEIESTQNCSDPKTIDDCVDDNSLALVPIDWPKATDVPTVQPSAIVNASVKDVLDALRHAREKLQRLMERRGVIVVASR